MVKNTAMLSFKCNMDNYGSLVPVEAGGDIPFDIQRIYYIYNVEEGMRRGYHSHLDLQQALVCVHGSVKILVKTPFEEENILLDDPTRALYIGPMVWREMYDFSPDAVLLVLASKHYDVNDYIRNYAEYEQQARDYFMRGGTGNEN